MWLGDWTAANYVVVQSPSRVWLFVTPWTATHQALLSFIISQSLPKFVSIESVRPSNHLILCCPFSCLPSFPASGTFPMSQLFASDNYKSINKIFSSFQSCLTPWDHMDCSTPGLPTHHQSWSLLRLMSMKSVMPSNHLILCHPLFFLPSIFPSIRVFSNESVFSLRSPKDWSFSFSISPSNEYSGLISLRIDRLDLLTVQETLRSLFQYHSSKASILQCLAFFMVQFSHPYMTLGKP